MKKRIITLILCISLLAVSLGVVSVFAVDGASQVADKGTIDVYLIAGQSNAVGYGAGAPNDDDERFTKGFDNVLYYGFGENNKKTELVNVKTGLGKSASDSGAEIGIASALADNGKMNAVIKCAWGATHLAPYLKADISKTRGTWTSPSYVANHPEVDSTSEIASGDFAGSVMTGNMYRRFITTVTDGIAKLKAEGYSPVIKGIWWMQGEAECYDATLAGQYGELLDYLISDMRRDVGTIVGEDLSALPFVMGKISRNCGKNYNNPTENYPNYSQAPYMEVIRSAMQNAADNGTNVFTVETTGLAQLDSWHFSADAQKWLGEQYVNAVLTAEGNAVTEYGIIPTAYANTSAYPFAVFNDGDFIGAYNSLTAAAKKAQEVGKTSQILLRKNVTASALADGGALNIDLGGYTLSASGTVFCGSSVSIKNGKIVLGNADFIKMQANSNTAYSVNIENCVVDFNSAAAGVSLVNANDSGNLADVSISFVGGEIISDNFGNYSLYTIGADDSAIFKKYNGSYLKITLSSAAAVPAVSYPTAEGNAEFLKLKTDGEKITYTLGAMYLEGYGAVPTEYASLEDYPLLAFYNGECIGGGAVWNNVAQTARGKIYGSANADKTACVVLRRDYDVTGRFYNTSQIGGTLVLDLNGYTMTATDCVFDGTAKHDGTGKSQDTYKVCDTKMISVKNGTFIIKSMAVISFNIHSSLIAEKTFNFNFENITFKLDKNYTAGTNIIVDVRKDSGVNKAIANITLKNCTLDLMSLNTTDKLVLFDSADENSANAVDVKTTVIGGTMLANEIDNVVWLRGDGDGDRLAFATDNGAYLKLYNDTLHATAPHQSIKLSSVEGLVLSFGRESLEGRRAVYTLSPGEKTEYGYIPYDYLDAAKYPFIVFRIKNGVNDTIIGYTTMNEALSSAKAWQNTWDSTGTVQDKVNKKSSVIFLRRDYTTTSKDHYDNWAQMENEVVIDLNGKTLTQGSGTKALFTKVTSKGSSLQGYIFDSTYTIKNGNIAVNDAPVFLVNVWDTVYSNNSYSISNKKINWNFESVTFKYVSGATATNMLIKYDNASVSPSDVAPFNFNYTDCTFDLTNAPASVTLFDASPASAASIKSTMNVIGGNIKLVSGKTVTLTKTESINGSSVTFKKDTNGNYITMQAPLGATIPAEALKTAEGTKYFVKNGTVGSDMRYTLAEFDLNTKYGVIPENYANAHTYPFVVFNEKKEFLGAYSYWLGNNGSGGALGGVRGYLNNSWNGTSYGENPKEAYILMRRDYTLNKDKDIKYDNLAQSQGTVHIDLGGHMLSAGTVSYPLIPAWSKGYSGSASGNPIFPTTVIVENGTMRHYQSGIVAMNTWDTTHNGGIANKNFYITFNNVTLGFVEGADAVGLIAHIWSESTSGGAPTVAAPFTITYNDCVFDISSTKSMHNSALIFKTNNSNFVKVTHVVNGGVIKSGGSKITVLENAFSYDSSVIFNKGSDGNYITMEAPLGTNVPANAFVTPEGEKYLVQTFASDGVAKYELEAFSTSTEYGTVTGEYANAQSYPFAVFDTKTGFVQGYATLKSAIEKVRARQYDANVWNGTSYGDNEVCSIILLRRDYTQTHANDYYENFAQLKGSVIIDLGGFTITQTDGNGIFANVTSKPAGGNVFPTTYTVKNGTLLVKTTAVIRGRQALGNGSQSMADKTFTWNFDNVNFGFVKGASATSLLVDYGNLATSTDHPSAYASAPFIFNYNNCTFDMTNAPSGAVVFNVSPKVAQALKVTVNVKGGNIISGEALPQLYTLNADSECSINFIKDANGNYITLTAPGTAVPSTDDVIIVDSGAECVFVKVSEDGESVNYALYPKVTVGYKIKTNITLWSNFVYNIYIPKENLNSFTVNGEAMDFQEVEVDGVIYYHVKVNLPAAELLSDIALKVTLNSGATTVDANWTLDVLGYTKAVLSGEFDSITKNLMKDMLVYASGAHTYFENVSEVSAKLTEIEDLLDGYTKITPSGEAKKPLDKTYFTDVEISLDGVPSFRFYLADGYSSDDFTFKVGGRTVEAELSNDGKYLEIVMYAYMMLDDVTFTVKGTGATESYNLYAYYEYAKGENDANLVAIVEALMKYSVSAKAYRDSVTKA